MFVCVFHAYSKHTFLLVPFTTLLGSAITAYTRRSARTTEIIAGWRKQGWWVHLICVLFGKFQENIYRALHNVSDAWKWINCDKPVLLEISVVDLLRTTLYLELDVPQWMSVLGLYSLRAVHWWMIQWGYVRQKPETNMKTDLAKSLQIPHQDFENHNCGVHFSALFISKSGVTIKGICLAISMVKIIKQFN